jgi:hypothetical protein
MEAARKSLKRQHLNGKEVAPMRPESQRSSGAAERRSRDGVATMRRTSDEVAARHSDMPARLAHEMIVIVRSCPIRGVDPDLIDAHEAYRHVYGESCERCTRRVNLRRAELQRSGVLQEATALV